jgi:hypothetical protein
MKLRAKNPEMIDSIWLEVWIDGFRSRLVYFQEEHQFNGFSAITASASAEAPWDNACMISFSFRLELIYHVT